jgi:hypothetical protein
MASQLQYQVKDIKYNCQVHNKTLHVQKKVAIDIDELLLKSLSQKVFSFLYGGSI